MLFSGVASVPTLQGNGAPEKTLVELNGGVETEVTVWPLRSFHFSSGSSSSGSSADVVSGSVGMGIPRIFFLPELPAPGTFRNFPSTASQKSSDLLEVRTS